MSDEEPIDPMQGLELKGPLYRLTRNPMYLGFLWILPGWGIFLSNAPAFLVLPGFVLSMNRSQIEPEERALTRLFGQAFVAYATRVRRWR